MFTCKNSGLAPAITRRLTNGGHNEDNQVNDLRLTLLCGDFIFRGQVLDFTRQTLDRWYNGWAAYYDNRRSLS